MEVFLPTKNARIEEPGAVCIYRALSIAATGSSPQHRDEEGYRMTNFETFIKEIDADIVTHDSETGTTKLACRVSGCEAKDVIVQPDYEGSGYLKVIQSGTLPACNRIEE